MDLRLVAKLLGGLLAIISLFLALPGIYGMVIGESAGRALIDSALIGFILGILLFLSQRSYRAELNHRMGFAIVALSWISAGILGAVPYYLSLSTSGFTDALFESISGFSGTGASILTNIEGTPKSILLWRSMTQWLGGMGIIVFFIAILPILGVGGVQLFRAEITGPQKDKITPRVRETAKKLWGLYLGLTVLLTVLLAVAGMPLYDAINHAMTTLATGGFSTRADGIAAFASPLIEYILIFFMLVASINFSLHFQLFSSRDLSVFWTTEAKWYLTILSVMTLFCTLSIWSHLPHTEGFFDAFRESLFTVVCTASSTGYTNSNYLLWPVGTHAAIVLLMAMGGMSGSTAGGLKCIRIAAAMKQLYKELKKVVHPRAIYTIKVNEHSVPEDIVNAIWGFIFLYLAVFSVMFLVLSFEGLSLVAAASSSLSALSNVGPALGELGPYDNYAHLSLLSKYTLMAGMLLGRLEFYTLLVLFTVEYWRK